MLMILVQREWTMRKRSKQGIWSRLVLVLFLGTWYIRIAAPAVYIRIRAPAVR